MPADWGQFLQQATVLQVVACIVAVLLLYYSMGRGLYTYRNRLFQRIAREYSLQLTINHYPLTMMVASDIEIRKLTGMLNRKQVEIKDIIATAFPQTYMELYFPHPVGGPYGPSARFFTQFSSGSEKEIKAEGATDYKILKAFLDKVGETA